MTTIEACHLRLGARIRMVREMVEEIEKAHLILSEYDAPPGPLRDRIRWLAHRWQDEYYLASTLIREEKQQT